MQKGKTLKLLRENTEEPWSWERFLKDTTHSAS